MQACGPLEPDPPPSPLFLKWANKSRGNNGTGVNWTKSKIRAYCIFFASVKARRLPQRRQGTLAKVW